MVLHPVITLTAKLTSLEDNHEKNRNNLRKIVINCFTKEKAGHGTGDDTSKYKYIVETLSSGKKIYLTRPAPLSKGFDFIIHVEDAVFINGRDNPKHDDISEDLRNKKQKDKQAYAKLMHALENVFYCKDLEHIYPEYESDLAIFTEGLSPELIMKVVKWLFIEQDIRYWNWSGRNMFMNGIKNI